MIVIRAGNKMEPKPFSHHGILLVSLLNLFMVCLALTTPDSTGSTVDKKVSSTYDTNTIRCSGHHPPEDRLTTANSHPTKESINRMKLYQHDPIEVGYVRKLELEPGIFFAMKTVAVNPPIFTIENFLTDEECDSIIDQAETTGLSMSVTKPKVSSRKPSSERRAKHDVFNENYFRSLDWDQNGLLNISEMHALFQATFKLVELTDDELNFILIEAILDINSDKHMDEEEFERIPSSLGHISRIIKALKKRPMSGHLLKKLVKGEDRRSSQARLDPQEYDSDRKLRDRLITATRLPRDIVYTSETLQVVHYDKSGHYHGHTDSLDISPNQICEHSSHLYPNEDNAEPRATRVCRKIFTDL